MDKLREKDIVKLSTITNISIYELTKLSAMSMLDKVATLDALILYDWKILKRSKKYTVGQMIVALMNEYQISRTRVQTVIYQKKKNEYFCKTCGRSTTKAELSRNCGFCDQCVAQSIQL